MIETAIQHQIIPDDNIIAMFSDEFQDLTPLLAELVAIWAKKTERYYIGGDPYQAIYTFMGATPSIFLEAKADRNVVLRQSHRCSVAVHDLSRKIVGRFKSRYQDDDFIPTKIPGQVITTFAPQVKWSQMLDKRVFYLHRTHYLMSLAYDELMSLGVPFGTIRGHESPLQMTKAKVVHTAFALLQGHNVSPAEIMRLMDYLPTRTARENYLIQGAKVGMKSIVDSKPGGNLTIRDLKRLGFTPDFMHYLNPDEILEPFKMSNQDKAYFSRLVSSYGTDVLAKDPPILLSTFHGVKGMECDTVVINTNLTKKTYDQFMLDPEPEHRLFYVGVTRAKNDVIVIQPDNSKNYWI